MFTGLIEEVGIVDSIETTESGSVLKIRARTVLEGLKTGDSLAIDGVCTTVVRFTPENFTIEASPETLSKTILGTLQPGSKVNLERPLTPTSRLGGHFVTGHVDGTALIISKEQDGMSWIYHFRLDSPELAPLLISKGSVTVNGISLTVNTVDKHIFSVAIIPHTLTHTNLGDYGPDSRVNIETDMLGKYVQRLMPQTAEKTPQPKKYSENPSLGLQPEAVERIGNSNFHTGIWFNLEKGEDVDKEIEKTREESF